MTGRAPWTGAARRRPVAALGFVLDQESGLQVTNGDQLHVVSIEDAETVEDLLNALNSSDAHLQAEINAARNGIDIRSRLSGSDFQIGENGGTTATELGVRTLHEGTRLEDANFGQGVHVASGTDFVIQRKDGLQLEIDVSDAATIATLSLRSTRIPATPETPWSLA